VGEGFVWTIKEYCTIYEKDSSYHQTWMATILSAIAKTLYKQEKYDDAF
jgi:hypothetical protein